MQAIVQGGKCGHYGFKESPTPVTTEPVLWTEVTLWQTNVRPSILFNFLYTVLGGDASWECL